MPQLRPRHAATFLLILSTVAYKCGQEDPNLAGPEDTLGWLSVDAVDSLDVAVGQAVVYVDDFPSGTTPLVLQLEAGDYVVDVDSTGMVSDPEDSTVTVFPTDTTFVVMVLRPGSSGPARGYLNISASSGGQPVEGVTVVIDGQDVGQTPFFLEVDPGSYLVAVDSLGFVSTIGDTSLAVARDDTARVEFPLTPGYRQTVFCKDFTNWDCAGCPETEELLLELTEHFSFSEVVTVSLHTFIPGFDDPFYLANDIEMRDRFFTFYGVRQNPAVAVDGIVLPTPDRASIEGAIETSRAVISPVDLEVTQSLNGTQASIDVTIRSVADVSGDWRLLVMMIQTEFDHVPGSNGQTHFTRVVRDYVPTTAGEAVSVTEGMDQSFHYDVDLLMGVAPPDDPANAAAVVVLQNWNTLEILQTASTLE